MNEQNGARYAVLNGMVCEALDAKISIFDRGFLYGDGLFETLPVYGGRPFLLKEHVARLCAGAHALRFEQKLDAMPWEDWAGALVQANALEQGVLRIAVSRGCAQGPGLRGVGASHPTVILTAAPPRAYPAHYRAPGVVVQRSAQIHPSPSMLPTEFKHSNYLASLLALDDARRGGADEALLVNQSGRVCEAAMSNVFVITATRLVTPCLEEGPLAGITRRLVLDLASSCGLNAQEQAVSWCDLAHSTECFLTNSLAGIVPVRAVVDPLSGEVMVRWVAPGPGTQRLTEAYWHLARTQAGAPWGLGAR